jgi:hypothetical protein
MGAEFSIMSVDELIEVINLPIGFSMKRVGDLSEEIASSLKRELSMVDFYMIDKINRSYFNPLQSVFGKEFANKFPTQAVFEVDEAGKCLALNRPTAAVFHLIRTMEVGILATSRCLQIADPIKPAERNWGRILEKIKRMELKKRPNTVDRIAGDGAFSRHSMLLLMLSKTRGVTQRCMSRINILMMNLSIFLLLSEVS